MDETSKIIIATLSGFIIAFLAEPVKDWVKHRNRLRGLKVALYKELLWNYKRTEQLSDRFYAASSLFFPNLPAVRDECYQYAIEHEISLFYELDEAPAIIGAQKEGVHMVLDAYDKFKELRQDNKELPEEETTKELDEICKRIEIASKVYADFFREGVRAGRYNAKLIKKLDKEIYTKIMDLEGHENK